MSAAHWVRRYGWAVALAAVGGAIAAWVLSHPKEKSAAADGYAKLGTAKASVLSALPGSEISPALSPDGTRVAYAWNGADRYQFDIYVKVIGSTAAPVRISDDADEDDLWPTWSPDGRRLAYVRDGAIYVNSANGSDERKVTEAAAGSIQWTADGKWIAAHSGRTGIVLVRVKDGGKRWLMHSGKETYGDPFFAVSRDLKKLLFARFEAADAADLFYTSDLEDVTRPRRRLTSHERGIYGLAWAEDRSSVFYAEGRDAFSARLQRLVFDALGNAKVEEIAAAGDHVAEPAVETSGEATRVGYTKIRVDSNLWYWKQGSEPRKMFAWDSEETAPQLSPDGARVAFVSNKGGAEELWVAGLDGGGAKALTKFGNARVTAAAWSPDGRSLAISAERAGNRDIWVASLDDKSPRQLTREASEEMRPRWSGDGSAIYFSSNRSGAAEIWKIPAGGGKAEQVTTDGGYEAVESSDGKFLYFTRANRPGLWRLPAGAKEPQRVLYLVEPGYWGISDKGVFYFDLPRLEDLPLRQRLLEWAPWSEKPSASLMYYDFDSRVVRKQRTVNAFLLRSRPGLSVSRDGGAAVWAQVDSSESDLGLVELRVP